MKKKLKILLIALALMVGAGLYVLNKALIIGSGYTAKYICSQVFMAERDADIVFEQDIAPTHPLFRFVSHQVHVDEFTVTAKAFGFLSPAMSVYRDGCGCTLAVDTALNALAQQCQGIAERPPSKPGKRVRMKGAPLHWTRCCACPADLTLKRFMRPLKM